MAALRCTVSVGEHWRDGPSLSADRPDADHDGIANSVVAFASDFNLLLFGRVLLGISIGGFWATAIALSGRLAPKGVGVAKATSIIMMGVTLATVLGVPGRHLASVA